MNKKIYLEIEQYDSEEISNSELLKSIGLESIIRKAQKAVGLSYAPYSEFTVGAAIMREDGKVFLGSNQEVASFPSCICAERVALAQAQHSKSRSAITDIAIVAHSGKTDSPVLAAPCGSCRQALCEAEQRQEKSIRIILFSESDGLKIIKSASDLLPLGFEGDVL